MPPPTLDFVSNAQICRNFSLETFFFLLFVTFYPKALLCFSPKYLQHNNLNNELFVGPKNWFSCKFRLGDAAKIWHKIWILSGFCNANCLRMHRSHFNRPRGVVWCFLMAVLTVGKLTANLSRAVANDFQNRFLLLCRTRLLIVNSVELGSVWRRQILARNKRLRAANVVFLNSATFEAQF